MNKLTNSFQPLVGKVAHTLILGTMPGQTSLEHQQYYAHKRNAFWPIMLSFLYSVPPSYEHAASFCYADRCSQLLKGGYALWDVLASCERPGSLDSSIVNNTATINDIASMASKHPELRQIFCNGRTAEKLFKKHIQPSLQALNTPCDQLKPHTSTRTIRMTCLPSTSPALASLSLIQTHDA